MLPRSAIRHPACARERDVGSADTMIDAALKGLPERRGSFARCGYAADAYFSPALFALFTRRLILFDAAPRYARIFSQALSLRRGSDNAVPPAAAGAAMTRLRQDAADTLRRYA